jgi:hypothetical protein
LISWSLTGWGGIYPGDLGPRVRGYPDKPQDHQQQQDQQHPEDVADRMPPLGGLWGP